MTIFSFLKRQVFRYYANYHPLLSFRTVFTISRWTQNCLMGRSITQSRLKWFRKSKRHFGHFCSQGFSIESLLVITQNNCLVINERTRIPTHLLLDTYILVEITGYNNQHRLKFWYTSISEKAWNDKHESIYFVIPFPSFSLVNGVAPHIIDYHSQGVAQTECWLYIRYHPTNKNTTYL